MALFKVWDCSRTVSYSWRTIYDENRHNKTNWTTMVTVDIKRK